MKTKYWLTLSVVAVGVLFTTNAHAGWSVSVSLGGPVYYPAPQPCPPPVVACPPRPVCPPPVVYCPPVRVVFPPVVCAPSPWSYAARDCDRYERNGRGNGHYRHGWR